MDWAPLWSDGPVIAGHALAALFALALAFWQLAGVKGTTRHRLVGWVRVAPLALVAARGFGIQEVRMIGPFSPIHLLSVVALVSLVSGVKAARGGAVQSHRWTMISLFWLALVVTGPFTLMPGRTMHAVVFGG